jgi:hypothetical protein
MMLAGRGPWSSSLPWRAMTLTRGDLCLNRHGLKDSRDGGLDDLVGLAIRRLSSTGAHTSTTL